MDWGTLFFGFSGRINRAKYWLAFVVLMVVGAVPLVVAVTSMSTVAWILTVLAVVAVTVSGIAVGVKRLHDRDKSGWWLLLFYIAPSLLGALGDMAGGAGVIFNLIGFGISIWALVELGFLRGTDGPNRFGSDPLAMPLARPGGAHSVS